MFGYYRNTSDPHTTKHEEVEDVFSEIEDVPIVLLYVDFEEFCSLNFAINHF